MKRLVTKIIRKILGVKTAASQSYEAYAVIHPTTVLLDGLKMRFDTFKESRKYVHIGEYGLIRANFIFESISGIVKIGNNVHIGGAQFISKTSITVEDDVTMAWGIMIYDHNSHSIEWENRKNDNRQCYQDYMDHNGNNIANKDWSKVETKPILIKSKVWIGFNVIILKGVTIGEGAVIGAGSVVTKDVPPWTVAAGNPAKVVKYLQTPA